MIEILSRKHCLWRSRYAANPSYVCELALADSVGSKNVKVDEAFRALPIVLRDPEATAAVLEISARELGDGLYLDRCDAVACCGGGDDFGVWQKLLDSARGTIVLDADDPDSFAWAGKFAGQRNIIFCALRSDGPALFTHATAGKEAVVVCTTAGRELIAVVRPIGQTPIIDVDDLLAPGRGVARLDIPNVVAAIGLALGLGIAEHTIREGLTGHGPGTAPAW